MLGNLNPFESQNLSNIKVSEIPALPSVSVSNIRGNYMYECMYLFCHQVRYNVIKVSMKLCIYVKRLKNLKHRIFKCKFLLFAQLLRG